jgi:hypothetical protein
MTELDLGEEVLILLGPTIHRPVAPRIESTAGHGHHAAQYLNRILRLLRLDEAISHADSLAKKAAAFFRMSRSMRNRSTSRRSACTSSVD